MLIKPLVSNLNSEKVARVCERAALSLLHLTILFGENSKNPTPRILKNLLNWSEEAKPEPKPNSKEIINDSEKEHEVYVKSAKSYQGLIHFLELLIEHYKENVFQRYSIIIEVALSEVKKVSSLLSNKNNISSSSESLSIFDLTSLMKNFKIIKVISGSLLNMYTLNRLEEILDYTLKFFQIINIGTETDSSKQKNGKGSPDKMNKLEGIQKRLRKIFKKIVMALGSGKIKNLDLKNQNHKDLISKVLTKTWEQFYELIKLRNSIALSVLAGKIIFFFLD